MNLERAHQYSTGRWTEEEHLLFLEALTQYGRDWKLVSSYVPSRSVVQIKSHAQKHFLKLEKSEDNRKVREFLQTQNEGRIVKSMREYSEFCKAWDSHTAKAQCFTFYMMFLQRLSFD